MGEIKTEQDYIEHLNDVYAGQDLLLDGSYDYLTVPMTGRVESVALEASRLLAQGHYGTALHMADPIAFDLGYQEWIKENGYTDAES